MKLWLVCVGAAIQCGAFRQAAIDMAPQCSDYNTGSPLQNWNQLSRVVTYKFGTQCRQQTEGLLQGLITKCKEKMGEQES